MIFRLAVAIFLTGCLLIAISFVWPHLAGGRKTWTNDEAAQLAAVQTELHGLREQQGNLFLKQKGGDERSAIAQQTAEKLEAAEARYKGLSARLEAARDKGQTTAIILRWGGVALVAAGVAGIAAARSRQA